ncbi:unnamed protein product [Rotaria sp. Silwood1]|nr:unnamed protein product [Rotaria sp. Silwood1]
MFDWNWFWLVGEIGISYGFYRWWKSNDKFLAVLEDFEFIADKGEVADVLQCNNQARSATSRGHQFPAAFLARVSGVDKHGCDSEKPLRYTHLDIAGSAGDLPHTPTGRPIPALCQMFLADRVL